jgi:hypothetical protein
LPQAAKTLIDAMTTTDMRRFGYARHMACSKDEKT